MMAIHVLHLITTVEEGKGIGGAEKLLLALIDAVDASRYKFSVVFHIPHDLRDSLERSKIEQLFLSKGVDVELFSSRGKLDFEAVTRLQKIIEKKDASVIHSHQPRLDFFGAIIAGRLKKPFIVTRHLSVMRFPINVFRKIIYWFIDTMFTMKQVKNVIAVSQQIAGDLNHYQFVCKEKIKVVYNGIDSQAFTSSTDAGERVRDEFKLQGKIVAGIIARINAQKGHSYFLKSASIVKKQRKDVKFLIVGDGPLRSRMEQLAVYYRLEDSVIFTGYRSDIPNIISALDMLVLSSLTEGLPVSILEAMAAAKPVVSFNVGGVGEIVEHKKNGLLVKAFNPEKLAEAIISLADDGALIKNMGKAGRAYVQRKFSLKAMLNGYLEIYERVSSGND